jgi:hypothetical protein
MHFCFVNIAVSCQLYPSTKVILICFQNICFEKEVFAPILVRMWMCLCKKNLNFLEGKTEIWNLKFWLWRTDVAIEQPLKLAKWSGTESGVENLQTNGRWSEKLSTAHVGHQVFNGQLRWQKYHICIICGSLCIKIDARDNVWYR